jgi:hypothetical protein
MSRIFSSNIKTQTTTSTNKTLMLIFLYHIHIRASLDVTVVCHYYYAVAHKNMQIYSDIDQVRLYVRCETCIN